MAFKVTMIAFAHLSNKLVYDKDTGLLAKVLYDHGSGRFNLLYINDQKVDFLKNYFNQLKPVTSTAYDQRRYIGDLLRGVSTSDVHIVPRREDILAMRRVESFLSKTSVQEVMFGESFLPVWLKEKMRKEEPAEGAVSFC